MGSLRFIITMAAVVVSGRLANGGSHSSTSITVNTSGSGTSESKVTGPDGVTTGHCSYTDLSGTHVEIKYKETANGEVTIQPDSKNVGNPKEALKKCREEVSKAQKVLEKNMEEHQRVFEEQEENFKKQQDAFQKNMDDFQKQMKDKETSSSELTDKAEKEVDKSMKEHEKVFADQDEKFKKQEEEFEKKMDKFEEQVGDTGGVGKCCGERKLIAVCAVIFSWVASLMIFF